MTQATELQRAETAPLPVVSEATAFLSMIERAARDPSVDVDKMERLMAMQERVVAKRAETEFNDAMAACQREIGTIAADATNPQTKSRYATYAKLDKVLRPIYTKHGLSISYGTADSPQPEHVRVIAYVARGGHTRMYQVDMPADGKGAKGGDVMTKTHATGAGIAYGCRYLLKAIFNVSVGEEDNDGNAANGLDVRRKVELLEGIAGARDDAAVKAVWSSAAAECFAAKDQASHDELRTAVAAKLKALKEAA